MEKIIKTKTVDVIATFNKKVVLIKRAKAPFEDKLVLPGGHFHLNDSDPAHACARKLWEELGLKIEAEALQFLTILQAPKRDPRYKHSLSYVFVLYLSKEPKMIPKNDAKKIVIRSLKSLKPEEIGFDHFEALKLL